MGDTRTDVAVQSGELTLPETRKHSIRAEEIYRESVRRELAKHKDGNAALRFFNTALGLWLLSTIVAGVAGTIYANVKENWDRSRAEVADARKVERDRRASIDHLDTEIAFRISNLLAYANDKYQKQRAALAKGDKSEIIPPRRPPLLLQETPAHAQENNYPLLGLYQEYREVPLNTLLGTLSELERHCAVTPGCGDEKAKAIDVVTNRVADPARTFSPAMERYEDNAIVFARIANQAFLLPRWRTKNFRYLNCTVAKPFC